MQEDALQEKQRQIEGMKLLFFSMKSILDLTDCQFTEFAHFRLEQITNRPSISELHSDTLNRWNH